MKVKEMNIGGSHIELYDDYIGSEEEKKDQLRKASSILLAGLERAAVQKEQTA